MNPGTPHRRPTRSYLLGAVALTLAGTAMGQPNAPKPGPATSAPGQPTKTYNPAPVELDLNPWKLESVGLTMFLPIDTQALANTAGGRSSVQITPGGGNSTWIVNIQTPRVTNSDTTAAQVCDSLVTEHFQNAGEVRVVREDDPTRTVEAGVKGKLIDLRKTIRIGGLDSERVYFSVPGSTAGSPEIVRGVTVFKTAPTQFVIFELVTTPAVLEKAKSIYEAMVATATFEDPAKIRLTRATAVAAGQKVLGEAAPQKLKDVIAAYPERWERCYKPASSGSDADAKELGYRRVTAKIGPRNAAGQLGGNQEGFIVQIESRMLDNGLTIDSAAAYFLSKDLGEESWTVQNTIRKGDQIQTLSERGARAGNGMVVQVEGGGVPAREVRPVFASDGYISRVESSLLPLLLVKSGVATDYGFYSYLSDESNVCYRRETLEQPPDRPGLWKLTTKLSDKKPPMVSYYNAKGQLMRQELPDGAVWEPVTPEKLMQLWKSKGLPVEKSKR